MLAVRGQEEKEEKKKDYNVHAERPGSQTSAPWLSTAAALNTEEMRIHFLSSPRAAAKEAVQRLIEVYGQKGIGEADFVVAVGGDGTALSALHAVLELPAKPVFAMRLPDSEGALANRFCLQRLHERLHAAERITITPLRAEAKRVNGEVVTLFGINEIVVTRQRLQAARLAVTIGALQPTRIVGDGMLISTPIGSTGYNEAAGGPRLKMDSRLLTLTGIAVRRPAEWASSVVEDQTTIEIEVIDPVHRPVRIETVLREVGDISSVRVSANHNKTLTLLAEERPWDLRPRT